MAEMLQDQLSIRPWAERDWPAVWAILQEAFRGGDTLAFGPETTEAEARRAWVELPPWSFVACDAAGTVLGFYFLKANQPGLGSHVCNAGYVTALAARGRGVAGAMCEHSQRQARALGFTAMQFNIVVSTNLPGVHLWRKHGFAIVGTLPGAFRHLTLGEVDAYVMYKKLEPC